jgi:hypothetical protein
MTASRRVRNVDTLRGENQAAGRIAPERDCDEHNSRSVMPAARLKNASRISGKSVSSAHRRNISAYAYNSLADELEAMTHLAHALTRDRNWPGICAEPKRAPRCARRGYVGAKGA